MAVVLRQLVTNLMPSVSGGAYQDARKVSLVWNDIQNIDACLNSEAERTKRVQALFSPPRLFSCERKDGAVGDASETTTTERAAASDVSYPLCSFLPFQTAN